MGASGQADLVMIKGILFDKDGTLLEFHSTQHSIYAALLACLKDDHQVPDPLLKQLSEALGHLPDRLTPDSLIQFSTNQQIAHALFDTCRSYTDERGWRQPFDANDLLELIEQFSLSDDVPYVALPNVLETLRYLRKKDYRLGVATVDTRTATVARLKKTGILEYFDYLGAGEDSRPKPDTSLADRFCSQCGILPHELLIVGDGKNDMLFAQNVGAHFIGIDTAGEGTPSVFREAGQRSVADIREIIDVLGL
jgi:phosphoglycolate phosphatase-like HAD superfamily hydrolase